MRMRGASSVAPLMSTPGCCFIYLRERWSECRFGRLVTHSIWYSLTSDLTTTASIPSFSPTASLIHSCIVAPFGTSFVLSSWSFSTIFARPFAVGTSCFGFCFFCEPLPPVALFLSFFRCEAGSSSSSSSSTHHLIQNVAQYLLALRCAKVHGVHAYLVLTALRSITIHGNGLRGSLPVAA